MSADRKPFVLSDAAKECLAQAPPLTESTITRLARVFDGADERIRLRREQQSPTAA